MCLGVKHGKTSHLCFPKVAIEENKHTISPETFMGVTFPFLDGEISRFHASFFLFSMFVGEIPVISRT